MRDQFADAFDTYLDILRRLNQAMNARLGRDGPNWRILHTCPCCHYKVYPIILREILNAHIS